MGTEDDFKKAAEAVRGGNVKAKKVDDELKLEMYALYKQATDGDCNTDKPGMLNFVEKAKWKAWHELVGMSKKDAMKKYIRRYEKLNE